MSERTIQERLRDAISDGTLLDEAADEMDRLTAENERLHFDYCRLADRKPTEGVEDDLLLIIHVGDGLDEFYANAADLRITDDDGNTYTVRREAID